MVYLMIGFILLSGCSNRGATSNPRKENIREPAVAGTWYPANSGELRRMIQEFLDNVKEARPQEMLPQAEGTSGKIYGIIAPHAGYDYSGQTAAYAFKQLSGRKYETVIIIGPKHPPKSPGVPQVSFRGVSIYPDGVWKTPLGSVEIDSTLASRIMSQSELIRYIPEAHLDEHSVEAEIPFLQMVLKDFKIVPIVIIDPSFKTCQILADAIIKSIEGKDVLIVASSDLYHGYDYEECKRSVEETASLISHYNIDGFYSAFINKNAACGGGPITTCMLVCRDTPWRVPTK